MSNIGSTAMSTAKQKGTQHPTGITPTSPAQGMFNTGTMSMLDEARQTVENAVGQGEALNPLIYNMLGLQPQYADTSAQLNQAQAAFQSAQDQYNQAKESMSNIQGIPPKKRTPQQKKQLAQLQRNMDALTLSLGKARDAYGQAQTSQKQITGFSRLDPSQIPANSPFSSANSLNQAQASETQRLLGYLSGTAAIDPTLVHQYDQAEQSLRAKLAARLGPDYENTSMGQLALQNFTQQRNNAYATWNQQQVEAYHQMAFGGQSQLQSQLASQIGLLQEPSQNQLNMGNALAQTTANRLNQQQIVNQFALGHGGVAVGTSGIGMGPSSGLGPISSALANWYKQPSTGGGGGGAAAPQMPSDTGFQGQDVVGGTAGAGVYSATTGAVTGASDAAALGAGSEAANAAIGF
jgi:hypothetical protein